MQYCCVSEDGFLFNLTATLENIIYHLFFFFFRDKSPHNPPKILLSFRLEGNNSVGCQKFPSQHVYGPGRGDGTLGQSNLSADSVRPTGFYKTCL